MERRAIALHQRSAGPPPPRAPPARRREKHGADDLLQVPARDLRQRVAEGDHLPLLGEADAPVLRRRRHGEDRLVGAAAAAPHRAAAAVEEAEVHPVLAAGLAQAPLGLVQRPVGHPVAPVLVAVGVAQHDLLEAAARLQLAGGRRGGRRGAFMRSPRRSRSSMVSKSGTKSSGAARALGVPDPRLLRQQHRLQQVAHRVRHADDVGARSTPAPRASASRTTAKVVQHHRGRLRELGVARRAAGAGSPAPP